MPSKNRQFKDATYAQFARVGKAFSAPKRLELLDLLSQGPRTVEVLAKESASTVANTSRHLQMLLQTRLVEADKQGLYVTYRLASPAVAGLYTRLRSLAEAQFVEVASLVQRFLAGKRGLLRVDGKALAQKMKAGQVILLDVRPSEEYRWAHISGARHVPLKELASRLAELPKGTEIVAYCRGPYCVLAVEAVLYLRAKGYQAAWLKDSVMDWDAQGLPVTYEARR